MLLMAVGVIVSFVFSIIILIQAFKTSILWGLGSIFIPFVILVYVFMNWADTKKSFLYVIGGWVLTVVGGVLGGASSALM